MDPMTAASFAVSIIAFVDFSYDLIKGIYGSTTRATKNAHISTVIDDLQKATEEIASDMEGNTKNERELCKLASSCRSLSHELLEILVKLKATETNSKWQSLSLRWQSMRKEK